MTNINTFQGIVGIGTNAPGSKLDVNDNNSSQTSKTLTLENPNAFGFNTGLNIGNSIVSRGRWQGDGISAIVDMSTIQMRKEANANYGDSYISFQTRYETNRGNGGAGTLTEKMRIAGNGNVGIGEVSPTQLLHVRGAGPQLFIEGASNEPAIIRGSSGPTYRDKYHEIAMGFYALATFGTSNYIDFKVNEGGESNSPSTRMRIRGDGNVGIGTTSPLSVLTVKSNYSGGTSSGFCLDAAASAQVFNLRLSSYVQGSSQVGYRFTVNNISSSVDALSFGYNGNVGIGVNSPTAKLEVHNSATVADFTGLVADFTGPWIRIGDARTSRTFSSGMGIKFHDAGSTHMSMGIKDGVFKIGATGSNGDTLFPGGGADQENTLCITTAGNVGIGTTTPSASFHNAMNKAILNNQLGLQTVNFYKTSGGNAGVTTQRYYRVYILNAYNNFQIIFRGFARNYTGSGDIQGWRRQYTVQRNHGAGVGIAHDSGEDINATGFTFAVSQTGNATQTIEIHFDVTWPNKPEMSTYLTFSAEVIGDSGSFAATSGV